MQGNTQPYTCSQYTDLEYSDHAGDSAPIFHAHASVLVLFTRKQSHL